MDDVLVFFNVKYIELLFLFSFKSCHLYSCSTLYSTIQVVSKQLHISKQENSSINEVNDFKCKTSSN